MSGRRLASKSSKKRSAPILFYMPDGSDALDRWYARRDERYDPAPSSRISLARTGSMFHLFIDQLYVDSYLSPAISNSFESQVGDPRLIAALEQLEN